MAPARIPRMVATSSAWLWCAGSVAEHSDSGCEDRGRSVLAHNDWDHGRLHASPEVAKNLNLSPFSASMNRTATIFSGNPSRDKAMFVSRRR